MSSTSPALKPQSFSSAARQDVYDFQQSGFPLGGEHEIYIPGDLHDGLIGNLPEFPQHMISSPLRIFSR